MKHLPLLALLLSACTTPPAQYTAPGQEVDAIFEDFTVEGSPGASVVVVRDGEVVHAAGYGLANLETGAPLTAETPVRLASVSKAFMCTAIMLLEQDGELGFDDPVTDWIPELGRFPGITVRHLMTHTSGIAEYYDDDAVLEYAVDADGDSLITNPEAAKLYETWGEPITAPGTEFRYSNSGYEMLALIIERASDQSVRDFLRERVFEPLEMDASDVRSRPSVQIPNAAVGYSPDGESWQENDDHWGNGLVGAGGVYASALDMAKWDQALFGRAAFSEKFWAPAFQPYPLNDGSLSDYGFGWGLGERFDRPAIAHSGGWVGFRTHMLRLTQEELTVIVLSNASANAGELATAVVEVYLETP